MPSAECRAPPTRRDREQPAWRDGASGYLDWAYAVDGLRTLDRAVLAYLAKVAGKEGRWQVTMAELANVAGVTRNPLRACLDRLAARQLVMFRAEAYRGRAQGAHDFHLVRNDEERQAAAQAGYGYTRSALGRDEERPPLLRLIASDEISPHPIGSASSPSAQQSREGQNLTGGRSASSPRVGELAHRGWVSCLTDVVLQQTPATNSAPLTPASGGGTEAYTIDDERCGEPATSPLPVNSLRGPAHTPPSAADHGRPAHTPPPAFVDFWRPYPLDAGMRQDLAERAWKRLSDEDRAAAIRHLPAFVAVTRARDPCRTLHPHRYLRGRVWAGHAGAARSPPAVAPIVNSHAGHGPFLESIATAIGPDVYRSWLEPCRIIDDGDGRVTLVLSSKLRRQRVEHQHGQAIEQAARNFDPPYRTVAYDVDEGLKLAASEAAG